MYEISLRADRNGLPLNVAGIGPGSGATAPFTTTLYVQGTAGGAPIPGGEDIFGCNLSGGLGVGSLYYLDGDSEHEDEDGNPLSFRSVTLGSNSGGASFHFHAGNQAGVATIVCSVTDPNDSRVVSASINITVGSATGMPANISWSGTPGYVGTQGNLNNLANSVTLQAFITDDATQPVPNSASNNLQVSIEPGGSAVNARLLSGTQNGQVLQLKSVGGVAEFALMGGSTTGTVLLRLMTDRADNDVSNGIDQAIVRYVSIPVVNAVAASPLAFADAGVTVTRRVPSAVPLVASAGLPPYTWTAVSSLPAGLTLSSGGVISGATTAAEGTYVAQVRVTDSAGASVTGNVTITVEPSNVAELAVNATSIPAQIGVPIGFALSATGGTPAYTWAALSTLPTGLSLNSNGVVSGTPTGPAASYSVAIRVTDADGNSAVGNITIIVSAPTP